MADSVIGALSVKITADTEGLKAGIKGAGDAVTVASKKLRKGVNVFGKWAAAGTVAAAGVTAAIFKSNAKTIDSLAKTSDKLGLTTEALAGLRFAAEQTGVSSQTMDMALQRMTRRLSDATTGAGPAAKALDELGLSAEELAAKSPDEALKTIADSMQNVTSQSDKVRLSFALFDSEGVGLVNTLAAGSEGLDQFGQRAKDLGIAISRVDASKVEEANDRLNEVNKVMQGVGQNITVELAPIISKLSELFVDNAVAAGSMGDVIADAIDKAGRVVGVFADGLHGIKIIFKGLKVLALGVVAGIAGAFKFLANDVLLKFSSMVKTAVLFPLKSVLSLVAPFSETATNALNAINEFAEPKRIQVLDEVFEGMVGTFNDAKNELHELAMTKLPSDQIKEFVEGAREEFNKLAEAKAKILKPETEDTPADGEAATPLAAYQAETIGLLEAMGIRFASMEEAQIAQNMRELEMLQQQKDAKLLTEEEYQKQSAELLRQNEEAKRAITLSNVQEGFRVLLSKSKAASKAMQGIAVVQAVIKGKQAAVDAWQAGMSTGGPWAPVVAAGYAAASIAKTASMISSIKSGGSSMGGSSGGGASVSTPSAGATGGGQQQQQQQASRNISINMKGSGMFSSEQVRELIGQINNEVGDGVNLATGI